MPPTRPSQMKNLGFLERTSYCVRAKSGSNEIPKVCILNHECYHCAFDQWMDAMDENEILLLAEAA